VNKSTLAQGLRNRLLQKRLVDKATLNNISDDDVIDSYITCSCCGMKSIKTQGELSCLILSSKDVEHFLSKSQKFH
jgi:transposase